MIITLNGPLGIGKSTLAEALSETIDHCVMLDGDCLVAANPPPADEMEYLHSTLAARSPGSLTRSIRRGAMRPDLTRLRDCPSLVA
jgi:adenylate kinase family enzyme